MRTIHRGMHRKEYTEQFRNLFNRLEAQIASGQMSPTEARAIVRQELAKMRQELRKGTKSLNKASDKITQPKDKTTDGTKGGEGADKSKW